MTKMNQKLQHSFCAIENNNHLNQRGLQSCKSNLFNKKNHINQRLLSFK